MSEVIPELLLRSQVESELLIRGLDVSGTVVELRQRLTGAIKDGVPVKDSIVQKIDPQTIITGFEAQYKELSFHVSAYAEDHCFGRSRQVLGRLKHMMKFLLLLSWKRKLSPQSSEQLSQLIRKLNKLFSEFVDLLWETPDPFVLLPERFQYEVCSGGNDDENLKQLSFKTDLLYQKVKCRIRSEMGADFASSARVEANEEQGDSNGTTLDVKEIALPTPSTSKMLKSRSENETANHVVSTAECEESGKKCVYAPISNPINKLLESFIVTDGLHITSLLEFIAKLLELRLFSGLSAAMIFESILPYTEDPLASRVRNAVVCNYSLDDFHADVLKYFIPGNLQRKLYHLKFDREQRAEESLADFVSDVKHAGEILRLGMSEEEIVKIIFENIYNKDRAGTICMHPTSFKDLDRFCIFFMNLQYDQEEKVRKKQERIRAKIEAEAIAAEECELTHEVVTLDSSFSPGQNSNGDVSLVEGNIDGGSSPSLVPVSFPLTSESQASNQKQVANVGNNDIDVSPTFVPESKHKVFPIAQSFWEMNDLRQSFNSGHNDSDPFPVFIPASARH